MKENNKNKESLKKLIVSSFMLFGFVFGAHAQTTNPQVTAKKRAQNLSNKMIKDLRLNNYQANQVRKINEEKINKMVAIESQYASNAKAADVNCQGVCRETDRELENILSTEQYSKYYGKRSNYYSYDKMYAANPDKSDQELEAKIKEELKAKHLAMRQAQESKDQSVAINKSGSGSSTSETAATPE